MQRYLATQGPQGWNGSLFVFDDRMFISGGSGGGCRAILAAFSWDCSGREQLLPGLSLYTAHAQSVGLVPGVSLVGRSQLFQQPSCTGP